MKTATAHTASHTPTAWRDLKRDWEGWSSWERRSVSALAFGSTASAFVWFALSLNLSF
jgi:hypothetical protein